MKRLSAALALALLATTTIARADPPPLAPHHLSYTLAGTSTGCPDEASFRQLVALRLGVDPFVASSLAAERKLVVAMDAGPPRTVTVTLADSAGKTLGKRVLREPPAACEELVANAAFAASVAIDPTVLTRTAEPAPAPVEPSPAPVATEPAPPVRDERPSPPAPASEKSAPIVPSLRAGAGASFGVLPSAAFGASFGARLRRERLSAGLEGRFDLPTESDRGAVVEASLILGELHLCGHLVPRGLSPFACAFAQAGGLRGAARGIATAKEDVSVYVAAGPRLGVTLPITDVLAIDARADVPFALTTTELRIDDRVVWRSPLVAAVIGAGVIVSLP